MSDEDERRLEDDESGLGGESPLIVPPARAQPTFDLANSIRIPTSSCRAKYMVDGALGKKECVCSKEVDVCKQHLPRRERGDVGSPGYYQGYPKKNAADPFKCPGGLLSTSYYSLENGDDIQAREAKQMGRNLQQDSSESEP